MSDRLGAPRRLVPALAMGMLVVISSCTPPQTSDTLLEPSMEEPDLPPAAPTSARSPTGTLCPGMLTLQAKWATQTTWATDEPEHTPTNTLSPTEPTCDSACRRELSKVTLFPQELSPSFVPFDDEFAFGASSLAELLRVGADGSFTGFWDSSTRGMLYGATVFLLKASERDAFDMATSQPDPFLGRLFKALEIRDVAYAEPPSHGIAAAGSSMELSGTCMFRGVQDPQAFDIALFREGILGVAIFYVYPIGATPTPDIASVVSVFEKKLATTLAPGPLATLEQYFVETATPSRAQAVVSAVVASSECGVSFKIPEGWEAVVFAEAPFGGSQCAWGIRPDNWTEIAAQTEYDPGDYAFSIATYEMPLEEAAFYGFFDLIGGQWYVMGRQGMLTPASAVKTKDLTILRGVGVFGLHDRQGSYVGLGEAPRAAASDGLHTAVIVGQVMEIEPAFELLLQTLQFNG